MNIVVLSTEKFNIGQTVEFNNNTITKAKTKPIGVVISKEKTPLNEYNNLCPYNFIYNIYKLDNYGVIMYDNDGKPILNENYDPNFDWKNNSDYYLICVQGFAPIIKQEIVNENWSKILEYEFTNLYFIK